MRLGNASDFPSALPPAGAQSCDGLASDGIPDGKHVGAQQSRLLSALSMPRTTGQAASAAFRWRPLRIGDSESVKSTHNM